MRHGAVFTFDGAFVLWFRQAAGEYNSSTFPCDERTDRGDDQVARNFIIKSKNHVEQRLENIGISTLG